MNTTRILETFSRFNVDTSFIIDEEGNHYEPTAGYAVTFLRCDSIHTAIEKLQPGQFIGCWSDPETCDCYIDIIDIFASNMRAFITANMRKQAGMYDFKNDKYIDLTGLF